MSSIRGFKDTGLPIWKRISRAKIKDKPWQNTVWQQQLRNGKPLEDLLVIDGHAHLGEYPGFYINKPDAASMIQVMDRIGVEAAVISSNAAIRSNPIYGNDQTRKAVEAFPGRLYGYFVANPYYVEDYVETMEEYLDLEGFVGVKLHPELHDDYPLRGPRYEPMWELASKRKIPVLFHTYFDGDSPEDIGWLADRYPRVPLLVGHMLQDKSLEAMAELANTFSNIYVDLTVPETFGVVEFFVEALDHIEQIIFGTDFPWGNCHFRVGAVIYARISDEETRKIMGLNALDLFGIHI
jgi:hypothetical protein